MPIDTTERGLEKLIFDALTGTPDTAKINTVRERPAVHGAAWIPGDPTDYNRRTLR